MPTSITDVAARRRNRAGLAFRARGFTLIEVLVVVVIIALLASLVAVNLAPDARQSLREEGARLAALLAHARDEAIVTGAPLAWQRTESGYRFLERAPGRTWRPLQTDASLRQRELPPGIRLEVAGLSAAVKGREPMILLSPTGFGDPFRITLVLGEQRLRVLYDGAGVPAVENPGL